MRHNRLQCGGTVASAWMFATLCSVLGTALTASAHGPWPDDAEPAPASAHSAQIEQSEPAEIPAASEAIDDDAAVAADAGDAGAVAADDDADAKAATAVTAERGIPDIAFSFKGATWDQVVDFFGRATGLPVVKEAPLPDGTVDYVSPRAYPMPEALQTLNILLQTRGLMLRVDGERLYLQKVGEMIRANIPTYIGQLPAEVTDDQIVTVVLSLVNADAKSVSEGLAKMVASYGSVTPMERQNAVVLVETAAQIRRLQRIIAELDREDVENIVEYIRIRYAKASEMVKSLTALMGERVIEYVIDPRSNQRVKLEETRLGGMTIAADDRTNAIVARGTRARIEILKQTIELLDVPGAADARAMRTFRLRQLTTQEATQQLNGIFARLPQAERPTIVAGVDGQRVTVIGSEAHVAEAASLLVEIDGLGSGLGGGAADGPIEMTIAVAPLRETAAESAVATVRALLGRDATTLTMLPGADGKSVILSGTQGQVDAAKAILAATDRPGRTERQVRVLKLVADDPEALVARALELHDAQSDPDDSRAAVTAEVDPATGTVVLGGEAPALARFGAIVDQLQSVAGPQADWRLIALEHAPVDEVVEFLTGLADGELAMVGGSGLPRPAFEAIERTNTLMVRAQPAQHQVIESLVRSVDVPQEAERGPLRILQLRTADAVNLAATLTATYTRRTAEERSKRPVTISADPQVNAILVAAHPEMLPEIERIVNELNDATRVSNEGREIRIFPLRVARAADLARTIDEMFPPPPVPIDPRGRPRTELQQPAEVIVRAEPQTNSLIVDAPVHRMAGFEELVESLDRAELADDVEIRTYRLTNADVDAAANTLRQLASAGSLGAGPANRRAPVTVTVEPATRTLVVAGPSDVFARVVEVIEGLDSRLDIPTTVLRFFRLESARAETVAPMLQEILAGRLVDEMPASRADVQQLLRVTTDRKANMLIISMPEALVPLAEELVRQLDNAVSDAGGVDPIIRVRPLTFADAREVSQSLMQALPAMMSRATGEPMSVRLIPASGSNALILVGLEADLREVEALVEPLDARPALDAIDARTFELAHAEAGRIAPVVQNLLNDQQETDPRIVLERLRQSRGQFNATPRVRVEADQRTNRLIVSGPQRTVALAETLIRELDRPDQDAERGYATFTPINAEARALAETLRQVMGSVGPAGARQTLQVFPEPQSGALLLVGGDDERTRALELLKEWDEATLAVPAMDLKIVTLRHSDARTIAPALTAVLQDRSRWPQRLQAAARAGLSIGQPTVTADAAGNRLLISAATELMPLATSLLNEIDRAGEGAASLDVRTFSLGTADAQAVGTALRNVLDARAASRPGEPRAAVAAEPGTNSVIVTGTPEQLAQAESIVRGLDSSMPRDQAQVRTVFLKHARAGEVVPLVESLLAEQDLIDPSTLPPWALADFMRTRQQMRGGRPDVRIAADDRLNAIVIAAVGSVLDAAEQMIAQLDVDRTEDGPAARRVRVITLANADAAEVASSLDAILAEDRGREQPPVIRASSGGESLVVRGTAAQLELIEGVVRDLDRAATLGGRQMRTIPIDPARADAGAVAELLQRMLGEGAEGTTVEVITLDELLKRTRPTTPSTPPRAPASGQSSARPSPPVGPHTSIIHSIALLAVTTVSADRVPDPVARPESATRSAETDVTVAVDERTNSLVIVGSPRAVDRLVELARQAESQVPPVPVSVRVIGLGSDGDPDRLRGLLTEMLRQITPAGGRAGDLGRRVAVLSDPTTSSLIVAATDRDFAIVADLIAAVARSPEADRVVVKVYPLERITAERAEASVRSLMTAPGAAPTARRGQPSPLRDLAVTLLAEGETIEGLFDPARVRVSADRQGNALIVTGQPEAITFMDRVVGIIDQPPAAAAPTLRLFQLEHARASGLRGALRDLIRTRHQQLQVPGAMAPELTADDRTNTLIVTAAPEQLVEIEALLVQLDVPEAHAMLPLRVIALEHAEPAALASMLERVVLGADRGRATGTLVVADPGSGRLLVRADEAVSREIDAVIAELDRPAAADFPVRTIVLERANAAAVAAAVQRFYEDRARIASAGRGRRDQARRVAIVGDESSSTLLVAASDDEFAQVQRIVEVFDSPAAVATVEVRLFPLRHAQANEISQAVEGLISELMWQEEPRFFGWGMPQQQQRQASTRRQSVAIRAETRLNALIVTGTGDRFEAVERLIELLDAPTPDGATRTVRLYRLRSAAPGLVVELLQDALGETQRQRRFWEPSDPRAPRIRADERARTIFVVASEQQHAEVAALIEGLDTAPEVGATVTQVVRLEYVRAGEAANALRQFLRDRAAMAGLADPQATIVASDSANTLLLAAGEEDLATLRDLIVRLDQSGTGDERRIDIVPLKDGKADDLARLVQSQFPRTAGGQGVLVTADLRTNSLIVNVPETQYAQVRSLIDRLDMRPESDVTVIRTFQLTGARADEAVRILSQTLQLDAQGRTAPGQGVAIRLDEDDSAPVQVRARIVADRRSNSLVVTGTEESFPIIQMLISRIDDVPAASPVEYRIVRLNHALADEVSWTLRGILRGGVDEPAPRIDYNRAENQLVIGATADQFEQIDRILSQIDVRSERQRTTDFVPLRFAAADKVREALAYFYGPGAFDADTPAKLAVTIVADTATNSLVISADEAEWEAIRALVAKLDSEEYDASLQLRVFPLMHADANSVARAINDAFRGQIERRGDVQAARRGQQQPQQRPQDDPRQQTPPTVLVTTEEWVSVAAEQQTNSVIVSASRPNQIKIQAIIDQIDTADFAKLPPPRLIPVTAGNPQQLAEAISRMFAPDDGTRARGRGALRILGDVGTSTLIVRAEDDEFRQIETLADALQQQAGEQGVTVKVLTLANAPAGRVASAIREAYTARARQANLPLSITVDGAGNALVVASTGPMFDEIRRTVEEMDRMAPAAGQAIFVIELEHLSPDAAKSVIETIGLDKPQPEGSSSRLVVEPIKISLIPGRNAIIVVGSPADRDTIVALLKALDAEPMLAESQVRIVALRKAQASAVAQVLGQMLNPADQQVQTPLARAVREQVRRLSVRRDGVAEPDLDLDLTKPVRIVADNQLNALVISSTPANVAALEQIIGMLDAVPLTDAVTVRIFPLENIAAEQFARIVRDLFAQGRNIAATPGSTVQAVPTGEAGKALMEQIAISVDDRTNTVIVAGKDDAVALVEVLAKRIDSDVAAGWLEPRIFRLRHADAEQLATTLQAIVVEGATAGPQATPLQRQVGRLRLLRRNDGQPLAPNDFVTADVFQPMTRTLIRADAQLNALVVVATPANIEVIAELIKQFDIEAASPSALVRIYPIQHGSAVRLATTITQLFEQQFQARAIRSEDRVQAQADQRTNSLVVSTSPRSFAVLEHLLRSLDAPLPPDVREIRTITLSHASAARLSAMIQQLMDARLERLRRVQPETADLERVLIIPDSRTNALIIAAGEESFEVVKRLATDLDRTPEEGEEAVQIVTLQRGNVQRIASTVQQILDRRYADLPAEVRRSQRPLVLTDARSNSLLVAAAPEDLAVVEQVVRRLEDAPINPAVGLHLIPLTGVRAEAIAPRLETVMAQRRQSLGEAATPADIVSIQPEQGSNSLIVAASEENLEILRGLLDTLLRADGLALGQTFEILTLTASRANDLLPLVRELYVNEENRRRGANSVRVSADMRLNAILVTGAPADIDAVRDLVGRLDGTRPDTVVDIQYIPLASANALETVALIENILGGRSVAGRGGQNTATVLRYLRQDEEGGVVEIEISAAVRESINLTPDVRTNTIIVSAPRSSMSLIERMIRDLDASNVGAQRIRVFQLTNADAVAMGEILSRLFNLQQRGDLLVLRPREQAVAGPAPAPIGDGFSPPAPDMSGMGGMGGLSGIELSAVPDERQQLSITVDSRTNSLLVSATPTYLDLVEQVVLELDAKEANERETHIYRLKNAVAADVARVVSGFVEEDQRKLIQTLSTDQLPSAARLLEREVTIVGDQKTNTVLVNASPRYMTRVQEMISELDIDPPQVLIQVLLAEVTLDSRDEWGVNLDLAFDIGSTTVGGGFGFASTFLASAGMPNVAVAGDDFDLLIRAMQSQGRLQVLSNPSVMAANNEAAEIQIGETVRLPDSTSFIQGQQQSSVSPEDIGVILNVTPTINPDGFVRMVISPEISELSARTTQISENFSSPIITRRRATTTVTVKDGETVVIGGLISDRFERRNSKVPFFGDLPLVGPLFRRDVQDTARTELLIVLTPRVVMSPSALRVPEQRAISDDEIDRLSVPEGLRERIRRGRLDRIEDLYDEDGVPTQRRYFEPPLDYMRPSPARREDDPTTAPPRESTGAP